MLDNYLILGSGLPGLTGNSWLDSFVIFIYALGAALLIKKFKDEFWPGVKSASSVKLSPSPLHVRKAADAATKDDLEEIKSEIEKIWDEVKDQRKVSRVALGKIHSRIDDLSTKTDTMSGEMKGELRGIHSVLEKLLERSMS